MKAVVFHGIGDILLGNVSEPRLKDATDAVVPHGQRDIRRRPAHDPRHPAPVLAPSSFQGDKGAQLISSFDLWLRTV
jgi:hypothetical protein